MALKKSKPSVQAVSLSWVKLWRDDLAEIADLMLEAAEPGESLLIQIDEDYTATAVEDLADHPKPRVDQVTMVVGGGRIRLVLAPTEAALEVVEPDLAATGMLMKVLAVARRCRTSSLLLRQAAEIMVEAVFSVVTRRWPTPPRINRSGAVVLTRTRAEAPSYWARKRDDVMLAIVSALVGGVIGYFVNMIS
ncbi:hypothetical protein [Lentzea cavernae]|uniref:Uncharacterized protein n=1 Tax=Lentzea cavernae TaxID=2020703 RepID=A0ABQ3MU65_9PSEU|nr:hypothetical protein [Lentzea cavernae]GHH61098.1 hypothetical protein GCM10017774_86520 [Lentzea cavernae]